VRDAGYERAAARTGGTGYAPAMLGRLDWGAILASVVAGLGITILLVTIGAALGLHAADDDNAGRVAAGIGTWTVISALLGTLAGTFIGGRFSRWQTPGSATYHGITSWGVTTLLGAWLGATGALGLLGSALGREDVGAQQAQQQGQGADAEQLTDAIAWGGWALALGMLLTLLAAIGGWWLGSRTAVTDAEADTPDGGRRREERPDTLTGT